MLLPKFVVLKSINNDKYLRYRHEKGLTLGFVHCSGDEASSPYAKFEVFKAKRNDKLIHLKCCYNDKYLTICDPEDKWIVAGADQPEEDKGKWSCTLFRPEFDGNDPRTVRFCRVQLDGYMFRGCDGDFTNCVRVGQHVDKTTSAFTYVDWDTIEPPKPKNYNIKIGAWGGWEGDDWSFEVDGGITKILIESKDVVNAVSFVGQTADGSGTIESPRFGGDGGDKSPEIVLEWPKEYLTLIRGTYGTVANCDSPVITSLEFKTNHGKKIGPFGKKNGTAFTLKMEGGAIVGFHGRSSSFIDAIGIFTRHVHTEEH